VSSVRSISRLLVQIVVLGGLVSYTLGCSLQRPLSTDQTSQLKGRTLARTERRRPPFFSAKPVQPLGLIGALVAAAYPSESDAAKAFDENGLVDPARAISRQLSRDLEQHLGLRHAPRRISFDSDDVTTIAVAAPDADLVIDIWTDDWSLVQLREDLSKFHLHYAASLRLIDARAVHGIDGKKGLVIAEGTCERSPEAPSSSATRNEMLADDARLLHAELEQAVQACIQDFRSQLLHVD
jgi:hypothetical protein